MSPAASFTVAVLPDTQIYTEEHPHHFDAQGRFLAQAAERENIVFAIHEGDVTNDNSEAQWAVARRALDPALARMPIAFALGNHDYGEAGSGGDRTTRFHDFFSVETLAGFSSFRGSFEPHRVDNAWYALDTAVGHFAILVLEFAPRGAVVEWAKGVLDACAEASVLLTTHAYLYRDGLRYDANDPREQKWHPNLYGVSRAEPTFDGEALHRALVEPFPNVRLVQNGHVLGIARREDRRADGSVVHQLLANYQSHAEGGQGFLRLLRFSRSPEGRLHARVRTYSPSLDRYDDDPSQDFVLAW